MHCRSAALRRVPDHTSRRRPCSRVSRWRHHVGWHAPGSNWTMDVTTNVTCAFPVTGHRDVMRTRESGFEWNAGLCTLLCINRARSIPYRCLAIRSCTSMTSRWLFLTRNCDLTDFNNIITVNGFHCRELPLHISSPSGLRRLGIKGVNLYHHRVDCGDLGSRGLIYIITEWTAETWDQGG